jgi:hypothetical protein
MVALLSFFVSFGSSLRAHASLDGAQVLPAASNRGVGSGDQRSQARPSEQVTLNLKDQPLELVAICHGCWLRLPVLVDAGCTELHT